MLKILEQWAKDNYENGGDLMVECWGDEEWAEFMAAHPVYTLSALKRRAAWYKALCSDIKGA